jgi:hypothetical protein
MSDNKFTNETEENDWDAPPPELGDYLFIVYTKRGFELQHSQITPATAICMLERALEHFRHRS